MTHNIFEDFRIFGPSEELTELLEYTEENETEIKTDSVSQHIQARELLQNYRHWVKTGDEEFLSESIKKYRELKQQEADRNRAIF
jgi:hypothetical protein